MHELGNPQDGFRSVHIGGTNGKGSSAHMLAAILQHAGYKIGLYTSPHMLDFRERIRIDGEMIPEEEVLKFFHAHRSFFEAQQLSFFEMTVGLAFQYFKSQAVDIAVIEVGLGGRLDSTNVISPVVSAITNIGWDHMQLLGDSLEAIAMEKAGIIKEGIPVVVGEERPELVQLFQQVAKERGAPIHYPDREAALLPMDLKGTYQAKNQQLVRAVVAQLIEEAFDIPDQAISEGLMQVTDITGLMGRWQQLQTSPVVVCDTAHNPAGLQLVVKQLLQYPADRLHLVIGMVSDKDSDTLLGILPKDAIYYFVQASIPRSIPAEKLQAAARQLGLKGAYYTSVEEGYRAALQEAREADLIFVGGSTFVVADLLLALYQDNPARNSL